MRLIPKDDDLVLTAVSNWADEVNFATSVGRLCDLNRVSERYEYNAKKVNKFVLQDLLLTEKWTVDEDYVMHPTNRKG